MAELKKHGFLIGVGAMVLFLLGFSYAFVLKWRSAYGDRENALKRVEGRLARFAKMAPEELPTPGLVELRTDEKTGLDAAEEAGTEYYETALKKLQELRFQPAGEVYQSGDAAGISNAYADALTELNQRYLRLKEAYVRAVYQEKQLAQLDEEEGDWKFLPIEVTPTQTFQSPEEQVEAAERCRVARSLFEAAMEAKWGGMTHIAFEKSKALEARKTPRRPEREKSRRSSGRKSGRSKRRRQEPTDEPVKPIDPRTLFDTIKVTVAGEIRYADVGPLLYHLYRRAQHETDPVFFQVEQIFLNKQEDRLLDAFYKSRWQEEATAVAASPHHEVRVPTATIRVVLSAVRWKGLPQEEGEEEEE
jgi:hypothetical protein